MVTSLAISTIQAHNIYTKIDDGKPNQGSVRANYNYGASPGIVNATNAVSHSVSTCYETTANTYSTNINNGLGLNCALSIKMQ